jgi:chaperone protein dnaK
MQAASQQMYQGAGAQPGADAGQQTQQEQPKQDETIQDADFEEVK